MMKNGLPFKNDCTACGLCVDVCSRKAVSKFVNKQGFFEISVKDSECVNCGLCAKVCPINNEVKRLEEPKKFWAWSKCDEIRLNSTSGGIFGQLATDFICQQIGVVVGASLVDGKNVKHVMIDSEKDVILLQGSKYLHSDTAGIYKKVVEKLKQDVGVLFSGTPCQIAAVKNLVRGKTYEKKLYTVEIVCHGITSFLFRDYGLELNHADGIKSFRNKDVGWGKYDMSYDSSIESSQEFKHFFYDAFFNDFFLRENCYNCKYASIPRIADVTIADGWGAEKAEFYDESCKKGVSLILINSDKGAQLVNENIKCIPALWKDFVPYNPCVVMNLSYLKNLSLSRYIYLIKNLFPKKLSAYIFACRSPKRGLGLLAKPYIKLMLKLKSGSTKKRDEQLKIFLKSKDCN